MLKLIISDDSTLGKKELEKNLKGVDENNIIRFYSPFDLSTIINEVLTQPFLSEKKVVILINFLTTKNKDDLDKISSYLEKIPDSTDLILYEDTKPDLRLSLFKKMNEIGQVVTINQPNQNDIPKYIQEKVKQLGGSITPSATQKLSLSVGTDITRLNNEIEKIYNYNQTITDESVEKLVKSDFNESIFQLMDAISNKNQKQALILLEKFMEEGENEAYLEIMIIRQIRNLLLVKDLSKNNSEAEIAKIAGLHPFVVKKSLAQSKRFTAEELLNIHDKLLKVDETLKTTSTDPKIILTQLINVITN